MDVIANVRRRFHIDNEAATFLATSFKLSCPTVHKHLKTVAESVYQADSTPKCNPSYHAAFSKSSAKKTEWGALYPQGINSRVIFEVDG
jgi:hypothetical protein